MKNQLLERITTLWGQGKAVKKVTRPAPLKGICFRALLLDANERPVEAVVFEAYDSSIASILWTQACEALAAAV